MLNTDFSVTASAVVLALLLDQILGEPKCWHPLVGFGRLANAVETNAPRSRFIGILAWLCVVMPVVLLSYWISINISGVLNLLFQTVVLYCAIGARSLVQHAFAIYYPLTVGDINQARHQLSRIVSRDTSPLDEKAIVRATIESVFENGADAVFAAIFWFLILGAPGAVLYRLANTLDAMWGYRNPRFITFGWAAARIDDLLNLIPARLTALSYCLCGDVNSGWRCWSQQAETWYSPNAGPVMAAGAGALKVCLGGSAVYHGKLKSRPVLGCGAEVEVVDISRACNLLKRAIGLWLVVIVIGGLISA